METKKFLWLLVQISFLCASLVGCESMGLKTRSQIENQSTQEPQDSTGNPPSSRQVEKPEFLKKETPRLGLILGGGGALSFAHIGVLQELETQKVPVAAIAGVEWGALVAGAYAMASKAHGIEWKLLKLPFKKFDNSSFFSSGKKAVKVSEFNSYLKSIFKNHRFSDLEIPFVCPYINVAKERGSLQTRGSVRNGVRNCWPYPPHFDIGAVGADIEGVYRLAKKLRAEGAEIVVYVDVLAQNKLLTKKSRQSSALTSLLWSQAKSGSERLKGVVDEVISVPLSGHHINSYQSLRAIVRSGQLKSKSKIKDMAHKYAY